MLRQCFISNQQAYGAGLYGAGYYGGFGLVYIADDWIWGRSINEQNSCIFTIIDNNSVEIIKGLEVRFLIDGSRSFAGIITDVKPYETLPNYLYYKVTCETFELLAEKRKIGAVFNNKNAGYIVNYIIDTVLFEEGITAGDIQDGITFDKVIFNYPSCKDALNKLKTACTGYNWHLDFDKKLYFIERSTNKCITTINTSFIHRGFTPNYTLNEFRDIQYIDGGKKETNLQPEITPTPKPDGESREFTVTLPIAREPVVETNLNGAGWTTQTVGINGLDTGKQFYWTYGSDKVSHDTSEVVLTDVDTIRVSYYGLLDIKLVYEDSALISERAAIDGNSGKYEEVFTNKDLGTNAAAVQYAKGLIDKYNKTDNIDLTIEYQIEDLDINKLIKVEKPLFGIDDWFLIKSINAEQQTPEYVTYSIKLLLGEDVGSYEDYFNSLLTRSHDINADDTLIKFKGVSEDWLYDGSITINAYQKLYPDVDLFPDIDLFPGTLIYTEVLYD